MKILSETPKIEIINDDCLNVLKAMPENSVDCVITSPPYYGLRDYGVEGQIGLEKTYQEYIQKLISIFLEVKRVLKKEGTCFVNLGDSYAGSNQGYGQKEKSKTGFQSATDGYFASSKNKTPISFYKNWAKSLMMIPERFAIAMIDNGWILRNKLVWIKPNAMPESVQDRWKKAHEYIFFFTKSKKYYFDLDAIRTPHKEVSIQRAQYEQGRNALGLNPSSMGKKYLDNKRYFGMPARMVKLNPKGACPPDYLMVNTNCSEKDSSDEHYATYPQALITPLLKAGSRETDTILDPFMGSGTTGVACVNLNRNFIGIEISEKYCQIAEERIKAVLAQQKLL